MGTAGPPSSTGPSPPARDSGAASRGGSGGSSASLPQEGGSPAPELQVRGRPLTCGAVCGQHASAAAAAPSGWMAAALGSKGLQPCAHHTHTQGEGMRTTRARKESARAPHAHAQGERARTTCKRKESTCAPAPARASKTLCSGRKPASGCQETLGRMTSREHED